MRRGHYFDVKAKPRPQAPGPFDVGDCGNDSEAGFDKDPETGLDNASEAGGGRLRGGSYGLR